MDRILISDLPVDCRIGVGEEERSRPQRLTISLELETDLSAAGRSDDLQATVDYVRVAETIIHTALAHPRRLIEALAEDVALEVLAAYGTDRVTVRVVKPSALEAQGAPHAAVEIKRRRRR